MQYATRLKYFLKHLEYIFNPIPAIQMETVEHCCALGTNYANSGLQCKTFQPPIASIRQEDESMCLNTVNVCCNAAYR